MFVDRVELHVQAGNGGRGMCSFRREMYVPRGGPDGGDGGNGGSIIVRAVQNSDNLSPLVHKKHWKAKSGEPGGTSHCHGKNARDLIIKVPPGTTVRDSERGNLLKDLLKIGDEVVVAKGGKGGRGNRYFASSTNRTPREFEPGEKAEIRTILLELKSIADVGLIGFPNAGKSTLLSRLSRARPEIADYPFTTKHPNLGIVSVGGDNSFVMADIPGLIEGASEGVGLGHEFLRHVERTRVLIHLVEPTPMDQSDPVLNYHAIRKELLGYSITLTEKPEMVCITKAELPEAEAVRQRLAEELGQDVELISAVTGQGLADVVRKAAVLIEELKQEEAEAKANAVPIEFSLESAVRIHEAEDEA